jgi:ATP-binding cassette subfamily F protein uup
VVTHDRAFLDRVCTRILELDRGRLRSYPGNFSAYETG